MLNKETHMPKLTLPSNPEHRERIITHYKIEKELASILRNATKKERKKLYTELYDELFNKVPYHPQVVNKVDPTARKRAVLRSLRLINKQISPETVFAEIGPGDCALSLEVSSRAKQVYAIDVSKEITRHTTLPDNLDIIISDGSSIDLPGNSVDLVYSNQLMEHLHPEDASEQIQNIHKILKKNGRYYCITPNRLTGPHDVSAYFDDIASGFHLKEYSNSEIYKLFMDAGFTRVIAYMGKNGIYIRIPIQWKIYLEKFIEILPSKLKTRFCKLIPVRLVLRIIIVGIK